ncbi:hypothetical protein EIN_344220 [Entamoeba invadens IP1]|uniref:Uncharacterized protein n=1 Tax=Entamoeba invadens IP1 TaxID=370355 RepID=A0A0A1U367_ENTIV|nr:hypothetical protein EIN_344220 [Entamoeba invadens IP1]ELP88492.1 hypothetical protein EIN_344220 [Entamoeba invadens IP1]|eukprot:XP_004255263.1 hypothetical protein EIN_344220 [Entamoeba invadens IP1]
MSHRRDCEGGKNKQLRQKNEEKFVVKMEVNQNTLQKSAQCFIDLKMKILDEFTQSTKRLDTLKEKVMRRLDENKEKHNKSQIAQMNWKRDIKNIINNFAQSMKTIENTDAYLKAKSLSVHNLRLMKRKVKNDLSKKEIIETNDLERLTKELDLVEKRIAGRKIQLDSVQSQLQERNDEIAKLNVRIESLKKPKDVAMPAPKKRAIRKKTKKD